MCAQQRDRPHSTDQRGRLYALGAGRFCAEPTPGRIIDLVEPDPGRITITDVARGLSRINRFVGQTRLPYSVAEHCIRVSQIIAPEQALKGLLHDAHEYITSDIPRPVKQLLLALDSGLAQLEVNLDEAIELAFNVDLGQTDELRRADDAAALEEQATLRHAGPSEGQYITRSLDNSAEAEQAFLARYHQLSITP